MNIFEIREVKNPDWAGYSDKHICYVAAKNEDKAYKKALINKSGFYPIKELSKRERKEIIRSSSEEILEARMIAFSVMTYEPIPDSTLNVNLKKKLHKKYKRRVKSLRKKYSYILSELKDI